MMPTEKPAAIAYRKQFSETAWLFEELGAALPLHYPGETVDYGHVGDLQEINVRLRGVLALVRGEDIDAS